MKISHKRITFAPMDRKIRIALVSHGFPEGGITRANQSIAARVGAAAPNMEFYILPDQKSYLKTVKELGIDIFVECSRLEKETDAIRKEGVKIVYADHGQPFAEQYAIIDRRMGGRKKRPLKRLLWHLFVKKQFEGTGKARQMAVERTARAYSKADAYVCLCQGYADEIRQALGLPINNKLWAIENPQQPVAEPVMEKEKRILFCGRLSRYDKRVDRLFRIWAKVQDQLPDYSLDIVGDGPERPALEKLAGKFGLKRISFYGNRTDTGTFYQRSSILCLTSHTEGWPLVLMEGQAHGVIPIAFDCSAGVKEVLSGGAGVLVPHADEDLFAKELLALCNTEDLLPMRKRCIEKSKEYSPERNTAQWLKLFQELV